MPATLTFNDDFNSLSLWNGVTGTWDTTFAFRPWNGNGASLPSNGEQEWYINANYAPTASVKPWAVSNGILTLTAAKVDPALAPLLGYTEKDLPALGSYGYTSGLIETNHSFSQTYGYFEMRAELPAGQGFWPAFWLMPQDGSWPPELDILEVLGNDPKTLYTTAHTAQTGTHTSSGLGSVVGDMSSGFHTFGVDWEADKITWYFDGKPVYQVATPADMNKPMYMIANLALGGGWGGAVSDAALPGQMQIDYIRAWNANPYTYTPEGSSGAGQTFAVTRDAQVVGTSGDDLFNAPLQGGETMTGGSGHDTYVFSALPWQGSHITDFRVGSDKLDLHALYPTYTGSDPIADGFVVLAADGHGGYNVLVNPDGHATTANPYPTFVVDLEGVTHVGLTAANLLVNTAAGQTAASTFSLSNTFQSVADGAGSAVSPPPVSPPASPPPAVSPPPSPPPASPPPVSPPASPPPVSPPPVSPPPVSPPPASPPGPDPSFVGTAGADTLTATVHGGETMTGGGGADVFAFRNVPWVGDHITDFVLGQDRLDFSALFAASGYTGSDPIGAGYVRLYDDGAGTWVIYDTDGPGTADLWGTSVVRLDGYAPSALNSANLFGLSGVSPPPVSPPPVSQPTAPPPPVSPPVAPPPAISPPPIASPPPVSPPPVSPAPVSPPAVSPQAPPPPASPPPVSGGSANPVTTAQIASAEHNVLRLDGDSANALAATLAATPLTAQALGAQLAKAAAPAASVAILSYEFFTGHTPSEAGLDYLVAASGPNPNNLNGAYYQSFNLENRYINFAVNLGKAGEGAATFAAQYAGLSLFDAAQKAYAAIFGAAPTDAKLHAILDSMVTVAGQEITRADYLALYGGDGPAGVGTKAALVGWLLAEAVKADVGTYALANDAYLTDVGLHGAPFAVDLIGAYAKADYIFHG